MVVKNALKQNLLCGNVRLASQIPFYEFGNTETRNYLIEKGNNHNRERGNDCATVRCGCIVACTL